MNYLFTLSMLLSVCFWMPPTVPPNDAVAILQKNKEVFELGDQEVLLTLDLINKKGKKRRQESTWTYLTTDDDIRYSLFRFKAPSDIKGTGFLSIEYPKKVEDRWLYLPAFGRSRRISANEKTDRFMGSDFTYEDLERVNLINFDYQLLGEETMDGQVCYKISAVPNNATTKSESGYSKRTYFVRKNSYHIVKIDHYNKKGKLSKIFLGKDIRQPAGTTIQRVHHMEAQDLETGHTSVIKLSNFKINRGVAVDGFTIRALEKP